MFDYLVVGSGLYGAVFAHEAKAAGKKVLVIDRRPNIAGNVYTEKIKDTFEKLYIRCSELIMHISLNIRSLYHRNEKNIDKFYVKY